MDIEESFDIIYMDGYEKELAKKVIEKNKNAIKILDAGNVTKDVIELKNEAESTEEETVGIILNNGVNQENEDLQLNIAGTPTISLKFQRLSTFTFTTEEQPEEE